MYNSTSVDCNETNCLIFNFLQRRGIKMNKTFFYKPNCI